MEKKYRQKIKMAAKSKKRLSTNENKLLKLDKLELNDVLCSICQSILLEPVTLPCFHDFCKNCFYGSVENNALCCPLCRLRIGSWLRSSTKQKRVVNEKLWNFLQFKFPNEIAAKLNGEELHLPEEKPNIRLSKPGEIRSEFEAELEKLRIERTQLEQKHIKETEEAIKRIQQEEEEAHKKYLKSLKEDELLALSIQNSSSQNITPKKSTPKRNRSQHVLVTKPKLRTGKIDSYLTRKTLKAVKESPLITDNNTSADPFTPKTLASSVPSRGSPEMVPSYSKYFKDILDTNLKKVSAFWRSPKEDGNSVSKVTCPQPESSNTNKKSIQSLPVSLPYTGILQHKKHLNSNWETGSDDSMHQELCYFKPIEGNTPVCSKSLRGVPVRVPGMRANRENVPQAVVAAGAAGPRVPSRAQYIDALCRLRNISLSQNLPSAFVVVLNLLRGNKETPMKTNVKRKASDSKTVTTSVILNTPRKKTRHMNQNSATELDGDIVLNSKKTFRRTKSTGGVKERTQKTIKLKERKAISDRKPYLRSDSKRNSLNSRSTPLGTDSDYKIRSAVKNLSSPFKNCDVKTLLKEQRQIENMIEQEKKDFELARKVDQDLNGRKGHRSSAKRQVTLNHALRPPKKLRIL